MLATKYRGVFTSALMHYQKSIIYSIVYTYIYIHICLCVCVIGQLERDPTYDYIVSHTLSSIGQYFASV